MMLYLHSSLNKNLEPILNGLESLTCPVPTVLFSLFTEILLKKIYFLDQLHPHKCNLRTV